MKKILILSYYFEPGNAVGAPRINSWANNFYESGLHPTVVTRQWKGNEMTWEDCLNDNLTPLKKEEAEHRTVYYLPYQSTIPAVVKNNRAASKLYFLYRFAIGKFNAEIDAYHCFKNFARHLLSTEKFDCILVSTPPFNLIRLAYELNKEFNIPYFVDFRDIWNNLVTSDTVKRTFKTVVFNSIEKFYFLKWLKKASRVYTVSSALKSEILPVFKGEIELITNGFEESKFKRVRESLPSKAEFVFSSIGTIYERQDISIFIEGLKIFYNEVKQNNDFKINLIGLEAVKPVAERLREELKGMNVLITAKLPREQALNYYSQSHLLFIPAWKNYKGIYTAKIFEYLGAGRNILAAPGDDDVIDTILNDTGAGSIANSVEEFVNILRTHYYEWKKKGSIDYHADAIKVSRYSREKQAKELVQSMLKAL